ncbi:mini-chromosome maintenance complex-binding protein isoform X5 [Hydra vulgaris]|uniref:Mini-chromosome maintenance complex-binding protein n=1 Tax=Hydra vulgaris TaxID=6087 RepID=A0ABM4BK01_HYDVU
MPEDFVMNPLSVITKLYHSDPGILNRLEDISNHFRSLLKDDYTKIPLVNEVPLELIPPNSLVRFKAMVQDMFDPEFYFGQYETINKITGQNNIQLGCFTDTIHCHKNSQALLFHHCTSSVSKKRPADDNNMEEDKIISDTCKKSKKDIQNDKAELIHDQVDISKNIPQLQGDDQTVFIKMYSDTTCLKLNDTAEFICILSANPEVVTNSSDDFESFTNGHDPSDLEEFAHNVPPSKVPRLHCLFFNKFNCFNQDIIIKKCLYESVFREIISIRGDIIALFTQLLGGDRLIAEYLLLHLISKVYGRCGTLCLGKFSMNITKCPGENFTTRLYSSIQSIVEKSAYFPLTIDSLNNKKFVPKKDYEANRLVYGALQLACNTQVVIDETQMQPGKLNAEGIRNLTAIGNVIQWQRLDYDFEFSQVEMEANLNMLVLSEGKSLLNCDIHIPLKPDGSYSDCVQELSDQQLEKIRLYLTAVQSLEYQLTEEVQKALEDDFVEMRKQDAKSVNADSFYLLLTTARYMSLSYGQTKLSSSLWIKSKELDMGRRNR